MTTIIEIPLSHNRTATIDAEDQELLQYKWRGLTTKTQYVVRSVHLGSHKYKSVALHREIMERVLGRKLLPGEQVDHKDTNPHNNCRENLRLATASQNQCNKGKTARNTSGYKGVVYHKKLAKWQAQIQKDKRSYYLGTFETPEEAYEAYCTAAKQLHGDFARVL